MSDLFQYVSEVPAVVPPGLVLVHNHVRPQRTLGRNGFRAWLDRPGDKYKRCDCDWAPRLEEHYRVRRVSEAVSG
jgi:hypothetical protein